MISYIAVMQKPYCYTVQVAIYVAYGFDLNPGGFIDVATEAITISTTKGK